MSTDVVWNEVPLPEHWGGFPVRVTEDELWQGMESRLHDRLVYLPVGAGSLPALDDARVWRVQRRWP